MSASRGLSISTPEEAKGLPVEGAQERPGLPAYGRPGHPLCWALKVARSPCPLLFSRLPLGKCVRQPG